MSDDDDLTEEGDDGDAAAPGSTKRQPRALDALAMRELRSARKLFAEGGTSAAEANFLVASANVLATLDLASAIRGSDGVSSDDGDLSSGTPQKRRRRR